MITGTAPYVEVFNSNWSDEPILGYRVCFLAPQGTVEIGTEARSAEAAIDQAEAYLESIDIVDYELEGWYPA